MSNILEGFTKNKDYLVCIDSDGCAMDTMDIKHIRCFGPCMIEEWGLAPWEGRILMRWNEVNLYSMTRGINRFKALELVLKEVDNSFKIIEGLEDLSQWVHSSRELSNGSLKASIEANGSMILKKALRWSETVNRRVDELLEEEKKPFKGVREAIEAICQRADVAIVSSANQEAILEEWKNHGLLKYTDIVLSQNAGSKASCIGQLLEKGYERERVLMVGDAPGDREAAAVNGVFYFPILVKKEEESWDRLLKEGFRRFAEGSFGGEYQEELLDEFERNLS